MTKVTSLRKQVLVLAVGLLSRDTVTYACIQWHLRMPEGAGTEKLMTDRQKAGRHPGEGKEKPASALQKIWFHGEVRHGHAETAHVCCGQICDL